MGRHTVIFSPLNKTVQVEDGTSLLEAAGQAGIVINSVCGGDGICGRCKMVVTGGRVRAEATPLLTREEVRQGVVLACRCYVEDNLLVDIPEATRAAEKVDLDEDAQRFSAPQPGMRAREFTRSPLVRKLYVELEKPSMDHPVADCQRVQDAVEKAAGGCATQMGLRIMRQLPGILRESDYRVTATFGQRRGVSEIMDVEPGNTADRHFMAVVDMGTSTIVTHLVRATDGRTVGAKACFNSQATYGREVTARIIAAEKRGVEPLQQSLVEDMNRLIAALATESGVNLKDITAVVAAGNTTMSHFLLGLPVRNLRRAPYVAASLEPPPFRAAEVGLRINPRGLLFSIPGIGGWVGGDITAGILATGLSRAEDVSMLIDVGTNGEIVVGNREWLMACSASTGPALEGASVKCGMMAERGAIEKVSAAGGALRYQVIGGTAPAGICGSGIIDLLAALLTMGVIDRAGKFVPNSHPGLVVERGRGRFVLCPAKDSSSGREVHVTEEEIANIVTAKAAVFAATKILLDRLSLTFSDVAQVFLAGGFGSYIDRKNAIRIGLLPDIPVSRIRYVGNTAIWGAKLAALSREADEELRQIQRLTTYYDLMSCGDYVEQFQQAMFLPHTHLELFPSVPEQAGRKAAGGKTMGREKGRARAAAPAA